MTEEKNQQDAAKNENTGIQQSGATKEPSNNEQNEQNKQGTPFTDDLAANVTMLKNAFYYPENNALRVREIYIPSLDREGVVMFIVGTAKVSLIEEHILMPLSQPTDDKENREDVPAFITKHLLTAALSKKQTALENTIKDLLDGHTLILIEGCSVAINVLTPGFHHRSIEKPELEIALKGPKESFVESMDVNYSLIRKILKTQDLMMDVVTLGERATSSVSILYIKSIANPELVQKVKDRVTEIKSDAVLSLSMLEQHMEERPYSLVPSLLITERPDTACAYMLEGHVVMLMDSAPGALIAPVTFWSFFHTAEDYYLRWHDSNFIRTLRLGSVFIALLLPSIYVAVSTYHVEMFPTDLMLAVAATRERVPFPVILEVLFMEISFEILREAGVRIPSVIGPTIGIFGALILGQAAVDANIVSPILVIIVSLTGLSSFAIPEISFNFAVRILRFFMLIIASAFGFFGISLTLAFLVAYLVSIKSFGIPFMSPMAPYFPSSKDLVIRPPIWKEWLRPLNIKPKDKQRRDKPKGI